MKENAFCRRFHATSPKEKALMTENLQNPTLKMLATRLLGRHYPEHLTPTQAAYFDDYMRQINPLDEAQAMIDYRGKKRLTAKAAQIEMNELRSQGGLLETQEQLLGELENYLKENLYNGLMHIAMFMNAFFKI